MSSGEKPTFEPAVKDLRLEISHLRHIHHSIVDSHQLQEGAVSEKYDTQKAAVAS